MSEPYKKGDVIKFKLFKPPFDEVEGVIEKVRKPKQEHNIAMYDIKVSKDIIPSGKTTRSHLDLTWRM